jgi:hypothetical protein
MEMSLVQASVQGLTKIMHFEIWTAMLVGVGIGTVVAATPQGFGTPLTLVAGGDQAAAPHRDRRIDRRERHSRRLYTCALQHPGRSRLPDYRSGRLCDGGNDKARRAPGAALRAGGLGALIEGKEKWRISITMSMGIFRLIRGLFVYLLETRWPSGVFFQ